MKEKELSEKHNRFIRIEYYRESKYFTKHKKELILLNIKLSLISILVSGHTQRGGVLSEWAFTFLFTCLFIQFQIKNHTS